MATNVTSINQLKEALFALKDVAIETKQRIHDFIDPCQNRRAKRQVMATAIVSVDEILEGDFSAFREFTDYLHTVDDVSQVVSRLVYHGRVAVAMNAGERYFFEHGECRLFDPDKKYLFRIIDEEILSRTGRSNGRQDIQTDDKDGHGVFESMENNYFKNFQTFSDAVILLYSFYLPCTIDFHNCSRLLHDFVDESGHNMAIGYKIVYEGTEKDTALKWLDTENIIVMELWKGKTRHTLVDNVIGYRYRLNDLIAFIDFDDDFEDIKEINHRPKRMLRRGLCRKFTKEYNTCIR